MQGQPDQFIDRLATSAMVLADRVNPLTMQHHGTKADGLVRSSDRDGLRGVTIESVKATVDEVAEDHHPLAHGIRSTAVLMHPRAHVERRRRDIAGPPIGSVADQDDPAGLGGPPLEPVGVLAVQPRLIERRVADSERFRGDG